MASTAKFFGDFQNEEDVFGQFGVTDSQRKGVEILVASYQRDGYEGWAAVLLRKDGQFYEVYSSHCSCNGLEWDVPELVEPKELRQRCHQRLSETYSDHREWHAAVLELLGPE